MDINLKLLGCFLLFTLFSSELYSQQPPKTKEELELFLKNIQKKADSMRNAALSKQSGGNTNTKPNTTTPPGKSQPGKVIENQKLPELDSAKVRRLPKKTFNLAELNNYLANLYDQLSKRFPADAVNSAKAISAKLGNNPAKMEAAALHAWQNGADEEAILLITKGAAESGGDGLMLVNAGGMLDMYGLSEKAIPVLRTIVNYNPNNIIALNNLGQAYTAIGLRDSAMYYIGRCLSLSPQHPEANNTAGHIELKKGNKARAQSYFENSLKGGFNLSAYTGLATIFKDDKSKLKIAHLIKPKVKHPEYFNQFKYNNLPRQCRNVFEAATVQEEFNAYKKMLNSEKRKFDLLQKEADKDMGKNWAQEFNQQMMNKVMQGESYMRPFQALGTVIEGETVLGYSKDVEDLLKFNKENREQYDLLRKEYQPAYEQMMKAGGGCASENALKNKYLERFAQLNEEWQSRNLLVLNKYIDDQLYWCYFSAYDLKDYRHRFYHYVNDYLYKLNYYAQIHVLEPCEEKDPEEVEPPKANELQEFDCPVDVEFSFVVGKVTMNCEKFSFKAGEGIIFKYEKKFTGHRQTTISIGAGAGVDATWKAGPIKAGFEAGMDMSVYLTFDKGGNLTDGGMTYGATRGAGVDFSAGERIKIKKGLGYVGETIGWRFGINSGVSFDTPNVPWLKDMPETPINRNVGIYQQ